MGWLVVSMDETFDEREVLLRAVLPSSRRPDFWRNGSLSSAALKDSRGLSVDRTYDRTVSDAVAVMTQRLTGLIVAITVQDCNSVHACVKYKPSLTNPYHSEIHGSDSEVMLTDLQAFILAKSATIQYEPNSEYNV